MRCHGLAVTLLGGWLCMTPPTVKKDGSIVPDLSAPTSRWEQQFASDSAHDCEERCTKMRVSWAANYWRWAQNPSSSGVPRMSGDDWRVLAVAMERRDASRPRSSMRPPDRVARIGPSKPARRRVALVVGDVVGDGALRG